MEVLLAAVVAVHAVEVAEEGRVVVAALLVKLKLLLLPFLSLPSWLQQIGQTLTKSGKEKAEMAEGNGDQERGDTLLPSKMSHRKR